ncbi:MAG: thiamine-phosphate kinase [bacterium]
MSKRTIIADLSEFRLLEQINALIQREDKDIILPPGDDCTAIRWPGNAVVASSDAMVEGVHFAREWTEPEDLAWKALAGAVSDLAAKGAEPVGALVTLGLMPEMEVDWILRMYRTWASLNEPWSCPILGGDTVRSPGFFVDLFVLGQPVLDAPISNRFAREGDVILVTGTLGDAAAGLEILQSKSVIHPGSSEEWVVNRFLRPVPRVSEMKRLLQAGVVPTAMTDISDGLGRSVLNLSHASGVGAHIRADDLPISDSMRNLKGSEAQRMAWHGGEDYELLLTVPQDQVRTALETARQIGVCLSSIGKVEGVAGDVVVDGLPDADRKPGYDHFTG